MKRTPLLLLVAALAACSHDGPVAGELAVRLASPRNTDRAILFRVVGAQHGVTPGTSTTYRVFSDTSSAGDTSWIAVVAPAGQAVVPGEIARLAVPDVRKAGDYKAAVLQVATASLAASDSVGVLLSIVKP